MERAQKGDLLDLGNAVQLGRFCCNCNLERMEYEKRALLDRNSSRLANEFV